MELPIHGDQRILCRFIGCRRVATDLHRRPFDERLEFRDKTVERSSVAASNLLHKRVDPFSGNLLHVSPNSLIIPMTIRLQHAALCPLATLHALDCTEGNRDRPDGESPCHPVRVAERMPDDDALSIRSASLLPARTIPPARWHGPHPRTPGLPMNGDRSADASCLPGRG